MDLLKGYILPRILQWFIVIIVGMTVTFIIPRLLPSDPVQQTLMRVSSMSFVDPAAIQSFRETLEDLYGLTGTVPEQYIAFWKRMLRGDLGPSLSAFPTPVISIIKTALPWTIGLLATTIVISWILGILLGTFAGYFPRNRVAQVYDKVLITIYPIPYFILALVLVMLFAYFWPVFPLVGGSSGVPSLNWRYISSIVWHAILPATSLVLGATAFRYIMARALTKTLVTSDFVTYAETATLPRRIILFYIMRNSMLPQITDLGLSLGAMFEGALVTEVVFGYPGIGFALYTAILQADFNMILGITLFSVVGIATAALIIDLSYPLFDPRVRYR